MTHSLLHHFGLDAGVSKITSFGDGLINSTWKVECPIGDFILQRINTAIFKNPQDIMTNIDAIGAWLGKYHPDYLFTAPIATHTGAYFITNSTGFYRLFSFVPGSHTINVVSSPAQAYEAAAQFARFTKLLSGFNVNSLHVTIPAFHDISLRYHQFLQSLETGNQQRIAASATFIKALLSHAGIVNQYIEIKDNVHFKLRVTHHDTKISNVLFNHYDKGLCVIDLDTVMPGYFISDVGDMLRTYLSPVSEEESDYSKIQVRKEYYKAIVDGYLSEMHDELTDTEKGHFLYAGTFMIYMQALRFMTDYFNDDMYYGEKYPGQNLVRAGNQLVLLERLLE